MAGPGAQAAEPQRREWRVDGDESVFAHEHGYRFSFDVSLQCGCAENAVSKEGDGSAALRGWVFWIGYVRVVVQLEMTDAATSDCGETSLLLGISSYGLAQGERATSLPDQINGADEAVEASREQHDAVMVLENRFLWFL